MSGGENVLRCRGSDSLRGAEAAANTLLSVRTAVTCCSCRAADVTRSNALD